MAESGFEKASLRSLSNDKAVMEWIASHVDELIEPEAGPFGLDARELAPRTRGVDRTRALVEGMTAGRLETIGATGFGMPEAIVQVTGRPPLLIKGGTWVEPKVPELKKRLNAARKPLELAIPKVGRVELINVPGVPYVGTGWMIDEDILITNRHVAQEFAYRSGRRFLLRTTPTGEVTGVEIDFKEEHVEPGDAAGKPYIAGLIEVVHIEDDGPGRPDFALLRIKRSAGLPKPIELSAAKIERDDDVAVIGYPAQDGSRNDPFVMARLFGNIYNVKRLSPGKVTAVDPGRTMLSHDCTTLGGNSGSVVVSLKDGRAAGLHFAGEYKTNNYAVTAETLRKRLGELRKRSQVSVSEAILPEEKVPTAADLKKRKGYDEKFLGKKVPLPTITGRHVLAPVTGRTDNLLHYLHFSVAIHKTRKLALFTAVNIDGNSLFDIRRSNDVWNLDPRMEPKFQTGPDLYKGNPLDRGHLVRRMDPGWGATRDEAVMAIEDTFFYTNSTPQHEGLNQKTWLGLEDYVLDNAKTHNLKVTVFTGPVFAKTDRVYRGVAIPEEYWKVVTIVDEDTGELSATAYLLSQAELIEDLEFAFGAYKAYQLPIATLEKKTGLSFGELGEFDPLAATESLGARLLRGVEDVRL